MTSNSFLKYQFVSLLFLISFITYAQETRVLEASSGEYELSETGLTSAVGQKSTGCFEYSGYVVSRKTGDPIAGAHIEIKNAVSGLVTSIRADKNGHYKVMMSCNKKYKMVFVGEGYSKELRIVKTGDNLKSPSINNRIYLTPFDSLVENNGSVEKIKIDPIIFNSDKSTEVAWDKMAIDKVLYTMLKFPNIRIKIESHSNAGGTEISNAVLSYFHAKSTRRYLIMQGIHPDRIESANGYGAGCLENECDNGSDCNGQESADSTRSDFIIVSN